MTLIRHVHSSGRHDRPAAAQERALHSYAARRADVITLTEQQGATHRRVLAQFQKTTGYDLAQGIGNGANCAILVDSDWTIEEVWADKVSNKEQRRGPGGPPPPEYVTALIRHKKTKKKALVSVLHLPSNVEGDWFKKGGFSGRVWRVRLWLEAERKWSKHLRKLRKRYKCKVIMVADWNLNFKRPVFRALMKSLHPKLKLTWKKFRKAGTHHKRIIDATLTNCKIRAWAYLIDDDPSSDHRPYEEILAI